MLDRWPFQGPEAETASEAAVAVVVWTEHRMNHYASHLPRDGRFSLLRTEEL